jgi:hypothetical protein
MAGAAAQDQPDYLGVNDAWYGFRYDEGGNPVCYMASQPQDTEYSQPVSSRGDSYMLITHRPAEGSQDVVSFYAGFPFREGSPVTVTIDGEEQFTLFTSGETAWPENEAADRALVEAMLAGAEMVVQSTSARGTVVTDTYSLFGATATREMINEACGLSPGA